MGPPGALRRQLLKRHWLRSQWRARRRLWKVRAMVQNAHRRASLLTLTGAMGLRWYMCTTETRSRAVTVIVCLTLQVRTTMRHCGNQTRVSHGGGARWDGTLGLRCRNACMYSVQALAALPFRTSMAVKCPPMSSVRGACTECPVVCQCTDVEVTSSHEPLHLGRPLALQSWVSKASAGRPCGPRALRLPATAAVASVPCAL